MPRSTFAMTCLMLCCFSSLRAQDTLSDQDAGAGAGAGAGVGAGVGARTGTALFNLYTYLDEYSESYYPNVNFPKLTTPQWVGETGVDAVVTLGVDDMRDTAKYEAYLRPILARLKRIDGRAPVSIMTCKTDPNDPQLQAWLKEGLSIETHTTDHPCPCLQGSDFAKAKQTYDTCVDTMFAIPNSQPVAFRFPCMDSKNTPSPRAFAEIVNKTTEQGNFLQASTSVVCVFTSKDPQLPKSLTLNDDGSERFQRYIPFPSFVNKIENYPYPYVIGKLCWEFPCSIPDDWQAQNIQKPNNPRTVDDIVAAIDATVIKQGVADLVFHPYDWIRSDQMASVVDRVDKKHGAKVKFLTFRECIDRINKNLLLDQPLRSADGGDNGVRILDLNQDGFLDVMIGNENMKVARVWDPSLGKWRDIQHTIQFTKQGKDGRVDLGVKIGQGQTGQTIFFANNEHEQAVFSFTGDSFVASELPKLLAKHRTSAAGVDRGVRLRDLDHDGVSEILVGNQNDRVILKRIDGHWRSVGKLPAAIVDRDGRDNGVRFVDVNEDGFQDQFVSNSQGAAIHLYETPSDGFTGTVPLTDVPPIVRAGTNNGVWFAKGHMWVQNEDTHRMPDGVDRRSFANLLASPTKQDSVPAPKSPIDSLNSIEVRDGFTVELVAAEPMVMDPVAMDWGADGKFWIAEMADYPLGIDDNGKPGGRIRFLEDTDGDGSYDKSTLFLDGIAYPTGVIAWRDGVIVSAAPTVFFAADRDGDGRAEFCEDLYRGFTEGNQQHLVNGFERGLDNWLYIANGDSGGTVQSVKTGKTIDIRGQDLRVRPDDGSLEPQAGRTQFGRHRDDHGNWFGCSNPLPLRHYILADHYLRRNPHVAPPSSHIDIATVGNTQLFPISQILSHWEGYKPPAPGTGHKFTSACSTMVYRDDLFGPDFASDTFTCEPVHNAVHRRKLIPDGLTFQSDRPDDAPKREFLASRDSWFRPATVTTGPDGALWIADMYRLVIEHPEWIDDALEKELFLRAGHDRGRIYRVYPTGKKPRTVAKFADMNSQQLLQQLGSPNGRTRDLAQALLIRRGDRSVSAALNKIVRQSDNPMARLHALCTLDGLKLLTPDVLVSAIQDDHPTVCRHAIRLSEPMIGGNEANADRLLESLSAVAERDGNDPHVGLQLAYSLGASDSVLATQLLAKIAARTHGSRYMRAAITSSLSQKHLADFHAAIQADADAARQYREPILQMAVRGKNGVFIEQQINKLTKQIDSRSPNADACDQLANTLSVIRSQKGKLTATSKQSIAAAVKAGLEIAASDMAVDTASDTTVGQRVAAIGLVGASGGHGELLNLIAAHEPVEVQVAAVKVLARTQPDALLKRFSILSPAVRAPAMQVMLSQESTALKITQAIEDTVVPLHAINRSDRQKLSGHYSEKVKQAAAKLFGSQNQAVDKQALLARYRSASPTAGDAQQGQAVFRKNCAACHQVKGVGHIVGPDLAAVKNRSAPAMLTAILDPNAAVEDKFRSYTVLTADGEVITGMIANESSTAVTLKMQEGKTKTILRDDIERIQSSGKSMMPEELEKVISPTDMSHLLAYLNDLAPAPKQFAGNQPKTVAPSANGMIQLTAGDCRIYGKRLVFEPKFKNIGYWSNPDDHVEWTFNSPPPGKYKVLVDYACSNHTSGNRFHFTCGTKTISATVQGTGTWNDYRQFNVGIVEFTSEQTSKTTTAEFRGEAGMRKNLLDLRSITLEPVE